MAHTHMHIDYGVPDWNAGCYRDTAPVRPSGRAWEMVHRPEKSDIAVVLCHGWRGYPGELVRPGADLFDRGFDVFCPRLPGMGTSGKDFHEAGWEDWYKASENCMKDAVRSYQIVYAAGHSMGCFTAILLAKRFHLTRLVLLSPAFEVTGLSDPDPSGPVQTIPWASDPSFHLHYENAPCDDAFYGKEYFSRIDPRPLHEFYLYREEALKALPEVKAHTLVLWGTKDAVVPGEAARKAALKPLGHNEFREVPGGTHFLCYDADSAAEDSAMAQTVAWLEA